MKMKPELTMGVVASIVGLLISIYFIIAGFLIANEVIIAGVIVLLSSIAGLIGTLKIESNYGKKPAFLMIGAGLFGFIGLFIIGFLILDEGFGILQYQLIPGLLFITAGIIILHKKS